MGDLDNWTDDRLAATLALAERIAGDLAVLVAALRPEPPPPVPDDGIRAGQWRIWCGSPSGPVPYRVDYPRSDDAWHVTMPVGVPCFNLVGSGIARDPIIPAPPDKSAVWAKPKAGQRLWDAAIKSWQTAQGDYADFDGMGAYAEATGYPREAGPWRWCEPLAETPAPTDDKVGRWFVRATDPTDAVQCLRPTGGRLENGESEYETTPCLAGRTVRFLLPEYWLPILPKPDVAVLATRGKRLTGEVRVPVGDEQYVVVNVVDGRDTVGTNAWPPDMDTCGGRRWIVEDIPQPQPKFQVPTWAKHTGDSWPWMVVSKGDGTVRTFCPNGRATNYESSAEADWTACEDPRTALTAALAKEGV